MPSKKTLFIVNPNSGKKGVKKVVQLLKKEVVDNNLKDIVYSEYPKHAIALVQENLSAYDIFIAVGGDGTVNEVASQLIYTDKILGVLPVGSGNGFAREFGFKKDLDLINAAIAKNKFKLIDTITINKHRFVNIAGIGFEGQVTATFSKMPQRGLKSYIKATLKTLTTFKSFKAEIITKSKTHTGEFFSLTIANTRQFGNNALIVPHAKPDDGQIDILLVKPFPKIMMAKFTGEMFMGLLKDSKYTAYLKTPDEVTIKTDMNTVHIDGESLEISSPFHIKMEAESLRVLCV
jgi:YegS/Rv2252/BmrU family lipid kinase